MESIQEINNQIDYISKIKAESKIALIEELKQKLLVAKQNIEFLEQIERITNIKFKTRKKESKC